VQFDTDQNREAARIAVARFRRGEDGREPCRPEAECNIGVDRVDIWRRAANYVDRILRGAKPGDLPVQLPTKFEMVVNRKAATALGLAIPPSILLRADEVIE
jgi:putative ABC transport system substrate-binding protein